MSVSSHLEGTAAQFRASDSRGHRSDENLRIRPTVQRGFGIDAAMAEEIDAYTAGKRAVDVLLAGAGTLLLFPLFLLIGLAIYCDDPGPILYSQTRIGLFGAPFRFYKFRSMVTNADVIAPSLRTRNEMDGPAFKMRRDPRTTRIGKVLRRFSLDELPQLINVLRGEMSIVGPRPHLPGEVAKYTPEQSQRLGVKPGLLCFREVSGRSDLSFERWIELDLEYIRRRSAVIDASIMCRAVPAVLLGRGAY